MNTFSPPSANALKLDHLVVAAATLEAGEQHVAEQLGIDVSALQRGGRHPGMGTHNSLLGLWGGRYLEVIAPDPQAEPPARHRWFALDQDDMRARLAQGPFLAHWVARVERPRHLATWQRQYPERIPPVIAMTRGAYRWHIAVPDDGALPAWQTAGQGVLPTLIQWDTPTHPAATLSDSGCALKRLRGFHAQAETIRAHLRWCGGESLVELEPTLVEPSLAAEIETPAGLRTLR